MMKNLKILIANDDGIRSEGIAHLARAAAQFGSVWVAAPERQCSGMSVRLTISETSEMAVYRYDFPCSGRSRLERGRNACRLRQGRPVRAAAVYAGRRSLRHQRRYERWT